MRMKIHGSELKGPDGRTLPLSAAVEVDGLVYLSGQIALRDGTVGGNVTEQTGVIFAAIESILAGAGLTLDHIVKATIWLSDPADFSDFNAAYTKYLNPPYPARSCVISRLVLANARVEIEVVATHAGTRAQTALR